MEALRSDGSLLCSLPDLPEARSSHSQTGLEACGGFYDPVAFYDSIDTDSIDDYDEDTHSTEVTCVRFRGGNWKHSQTLKWERTSHSSWASPEGTVIIGGHFGKVVETTELLNHTTGDSAMHFPLKSSVS